MDAIGAVTHMVKPVILQQDMLHSPTLPPLGFWRDVDSGTRAVPEQAAGHLRRLRFQEEAPGQNLLKPAVPHDQMGSHATVQQQPIPCQGAVKHTRAARAVRSSATSITRQRPSSRQRNSRS